MFLFSRFFIFFTINTFSIANFERTLQCGSLFSQPTTNHIFAFLFLNLAFLSKHCSNLNCNTCELDEGVDLSLVVYTCLPDLTLMLLSFSKKAVHFNLVIQTIFKMMF